MREQNELNKNPRFVELFRKGNSMTDGEFREFAQIAKKHGRTLEQFLEKVEEYFYPEEFERWERLAVEVWEKNSLTKSYQDLSLLSYLGDFREHEIIGKSTSNPTNNLENSLAGENNGWVLVNKSSTPCQSLTKEEKELAPLSLDWLTEDNDDEIFSDPTSISSANPSLIENGEETPRPPKNPDKPGPNLPPTSEGPSPPGCAAPPLPNGISESILASYEGSTANWRAIVWTFAKALREQVGERSPSEFKDVIYHVCSQIDFKCTSEQFYNEFIKCWNKYKPPAKDTLGWAVNRSKTHPIPNPYGDTSLYNLVYSICYYVSNGGEHEFYLGQEVLASKLGVEQEDISTVLANLESDKAIIVIAPSNWKESDAKTYEFLDQPN